MTKGVCHCGNISFQTTENPSWLTDCNCSICRRVAALWGHLPIASVSIEKKGETIAYVQGDKTLAIHSCVSCGCTTHWENLDPASGEPIMAVNFRMCSNEDIARHRIRKFDGADTWSFLD